METVRFIRGVPNLDPTQERIEIENIGWTIGNECPYRCNHCYSMSAREKGKDLIVADIDRIVDQLAVNGIKTVNLGGNEPLFTSGLDPKKTLLPHIIRSLYDRRIVVGLTSAGITINYLAKHHSQEFALLNDVDISLDSPFPAEHNTNRGAVLYGQAIKALNVCQQAGIDHTVVMCGMIWNLSDRHVDELVNVARNTGSNVRINYIKPTEPDHLHMLPSPELFYRASIRLMSQCEPLDLGEPLLSTVFSGVGKGCPCGTKSFRIHSITPDGRVPVSPCVYLHDYRVGDMLKDDLADIVRSRQFREFRSRRTNPEQVQGCGGCEHLQSCRGGCPARAYLSTPRGVHGLMVKDPYCVTDMVGRNFPIPALPDVRVNSDVVLVHRDYLCTLILRPKQ